MPSIPSTADIARMVNAVPVMPLVNTITGRQQVGAQQPFGMGVPKPELIPGLSQFIKDFTPVVRSEFSGGRQDIAQAVQPWQALGGMARTALSPATAAIRAGAAKPIGRTSRLLGAPEGVAQGIETGAEVAANLLLPGVGFVPMSRAPKTVEQVKQSIEKIWPSGPPRHRKSST